jgi:hypothetical protein
VKGLRQRKTVTIRKELEERVRLGKQSHLISSTARRSDGVHVRVVPARRPDLTAEPVSATLEDAYLYLISKAN